MGLEGLGLLGDVLMPKRRLKTKIVVLLSGGMDSFAMALLYTNESFDLYPLFIDYGQRASKREWAACENICKFLKLRKPRKVSIPSLSKLTENLLTNRSLKNGDPFFPFRNVILVSIGALYGHNINSNLVALGIVGGGAAPFPDCSHEFTLSLSKLLSSSVNSDVKVFTPFSNFSKDEVLWYGVNSRLPYKMTYSCYLGEPRHCGKCRACISRKQAFKILGIKDPTRYEE